MIRTQETTTGIRVSIFVPKSDNSLPGCLYPTTMVTMAPIKVMPKVTQVCLYETLILLLSHDMKHFEFEVDSLFCAAGLNVQVPKHGVRTSAGKLKQALHAFLKPRVDHNTQQA